MSIVAYLIGRMRGEPGFGRGYQASVIILWLFLFLFHCRKPRVTEMMVEARILEAHPDKLLACRQ